MTVAFTPCFAAPRDQMRILILSQVRGVPRPQPIEVSL